MVRPFTASKPEQDLVAMSMRIAADTASDYSALMPSRPGCRPIAFFGPIERAEVVTFGLNPSSGEFTYERNWSGVTDSAVPDELVNYWTNEKRTPHPWFKPWETVLSEVGASYAANAAHIDLSPRATNGCKGNLKDQFTDMLCTDAPVWISALRIATACKLILAAGAVTNAYYINEFITKRLADKGVQLEGNWFRNGEGHSNGEGHTTLHTLRLPTGRSIPFFFCSTGPSARNWPSLVSACRSNMGTLKRHFTGGQSQNAHA